MSNFVHIGEKVASQGREALTHSVSKTLLQLLDADEAKSGVRLLNGNIWALHEGPGVKIKSLIKESVHQMFEKGLTPFISHMTCGNINMD